MSFGRRLPAAPSAASRLIDNVILINLKFRVWPQRRFRVWPQRRVFFGRSAGYSLAAAQGILWPQRNSVTSLDPAGELGPGGQRQLVDFYLTFY